MKIGAYLNNSSYINYSQKQNKEVNFGNHTLSKALPEPLSNKMQREGISIIWSHFQKQPKGRSFLTLIAEKGGKKETQRVHVGYQHKTQIDSPENLKTYTELGINNLLTRFPNQ